ncbi:hypothetical protein GCM10009665_25350 [Kitasatospora nipponensis]|uniref:Uncharacterized protein n=1 Tax=Kitasatospora nipponensis TaxID=258049 RepID=A0ABN1W6R2_9ACTN
MEILIMMALAYALGGGITAGHATAQQHTKTPKAPKPIDRTQAGRKATQGAINSIARVYTWSSGAKEGWRKAWPETKTAISERRATVKAAKAERKTTVDAQKTAPAKTAPQTPQDPEILDAEIVEDDEVVNTGGPTAPSTEKIAEAKAAGAAASTDATVRVHVVADPAPPAGATVAGARPVPPKPTHRPTAGGPGPATPTGHGPAPARAPSGLFPPDEPLEDLPDWLFRDDLLGAPSSRAEPQAPAAPGLRLVKDPALPTPAPPIPAPPGPATGGAATPRSSMTNLPTASAGTATVEVNGVDSLQLWLRQMHGWAQLEMEDAQAAVTRISDLQAKAEAAYAAAAGAKYDPKTLGELAAIVDQLGHLRATREKDLASSELAAHNATASGHNVQFRHGAINEAAAAAPVEMAESTTYGD